MKLSTLLIGAISAVSAWGKGELYVYQDYSAGVPPGGFTKNFKDMMGAGITHVLLTFWMPSGHVDSLITWSSLVSEQDRTSAKQVIKDAGGKLLMSVGGSTWGNWWSLDETQIAAQAVADAKRLQFDGIDYDLEGSAIPQWVNFVAKFVTATRKIAPEMFITIAPQPPYFSPDYRIDLDVACKYFDNGADGRPFVDKILMQYYNNPRSTTQSSGSYPTLEGIVESNLEKSAATQIFQMCENHLQKGIPRDRLIIGRPARPSLDAGGNEPLALDHVQLNCKAQSVGAGGFMLWKYRDSDLDLYRQIQTCNSRNTNDIITTRPVPSTVPTVPTVRTVPTTQVVETTKYVSTEDLEAIRERERRQREEEERRKHQESIDKKHADKTEAVTTHSTAKPVDHPTGDSSDNVSLCRNRIVGKIPGWTAHCHELCQYFSSPAFCGHKSGSDYVTCVLTSSPPGTCIANP